MKLDINNGEKHMDLGLLHKQINIELSHLDFEKIWPGFKPLKFALFNQDKCYFDGKYIKKTAAFCANTSILYEGEYIATWMVAEDLPIEVLTSKLVHEMFHGFQNKQGWNCWPDEIEALFRYEYSAENLSIKLRENKLLLSLLDHFDNNMLEELLSLRKKRSIDFPYQFMYEIKTEEIEGTANYVEWQVLKQLDTKKANDLLKNMHLEMTEINHMFPIRISCYYSGALMINALVNKGIYDFNSNVRPTLLSILDNIKSLVSNLRSEENLCKAKEAVNKYYTETEEIIKNVVAKNEIALKGPLELGYVNIYNARYHNNYITTTYFLMYKENGENKMLPGNYVVKMLDEKIIDLVYKWEK